MLFILFYCVKLIFEFAKIGTFLLQNKIFSVNNCKFDLFTLFLQYFLNKKLLKGAQKLPFLII